MADPQGVLKIAPIDGGLMVRVEGRGTMRESAVARESLLPTLAGDTPLQAVVDLTACEHLDSTFLGCLMDLHRAAAAKGGGFAVACDAENCKRLLGAMRLDRLLRVLPQPPAPLADWTTLSMPALDPAALSRHVLQCHARLAELDTPLQPVFQKIVAQLRKELEGGGLGTG
jgi:anti-anti-sigma factor